MIITSEVSLEAGPRLGSLADLFSPQAPDGAWVRLYDGVPRRPHSGFCADACEPVPEDITEPHHVSAEGYDEPDVSIAAYRNALLLPSAVAVTRDARVVSESAVGVKSFRGSLDRAKTFSRDGEGRLRVLPQLVDQAAAIPGNALWFYHMRPLVFGHWLSEALTSLNLMGPPIRAGRLRVIVPQLPGHWTDKLLDCVGLPKGVRVHRTSQSLRCDTLFVSSSCDARATYFPTAILLRMAGAMRSSFAKAGPPLRLFLVRPAEVTTSRRSLINEREVFEALAPLGFRPIEPSRLTLPQQIDVFSRAESVVGLQGSAFANLVFCRPGTSVLVIQPAEQMRLAHWTLNLTNLAGLRYAHVFARRLEASENWRNWVGTIDPKAVRRSVEVLLGSTGAVDLTSGSAPASQLSRSTRP